MSNKDEWFKATPFSVRLDAEASSDSIPQVAATMVRVAENLGLPVISDINGHDMFASPGEAAKEVHARWLHLFHHAEHVRLKSPPSAPSVPPEDKQVSIVVRTIDNNDLAGTLYTSCSERDYNALRTIANVLTAPLSRRGLRIEVMVDPST